MDRRQFLRTGLLAGVAATALASCSSTATTSAVTSDVGASSPPRSPSPQQSLGPTGADASPRALLAYFSRAGENYHYGDRIILKVGNTKVVADMIAAAAPVDLHEIEAADPYPVDYEATVARNVQEEQDNARPAIANPLPDLSEYHTILLGSPVWNVQAPMIMRTFIEGVDLSGKTLHPFVTYAVSGMGTVRDDYATWLPDTTVTQGLAIQGETATDSRTQVDDWLDSIGLTTSGQR